MPIEEVRLEDRKSGARATAVVLAAAMPTISQVRLASVVILFGSRATNLPPHGRV
jgi:hypothetical protein